MIFGDPNTNEHCHTHNWMGLEGQDCPRCATAESPGPPFAVYEDYEGGLHIIDATTRTVLSDTYAYDRDDSGRNARMEAIAKTLTRGWSGGAPPAARPAEPPPVLMRVIAPGVFVPVDESEYKAYFAARAAPPPSEWLKRVERGVRFADVEQGVDNSR